MLSATVIYHRNLAHVFLIFKVTFEEFIPIQFFAVLAFELSFLVLTVFANSYLVSILKFKSFKFPASLGFLKRIYVVCSMEIARLINY
jgi:hypothetical protein